LLASSPSQQSSAIIAAIVGCCSVLACHHRVIIMQPFRFGFHVFPSFFSSFGVRAVARFFRFFIL